MTDSAISSLYGSSRTDARVSARARILRRDDIHRHLAHQAIHETGKHIGEPGFVAGPDRRCCRLIDQSPLGEIPFSPAEEDRHAPQNAFGDQGQKFLMPQSGPISADQHHAQAAFFETRGGAQFGREQNMRAVRPHRVAEMKEAPAAIPMPAGGVEVIVDGAALAGPHMHADLIGRFDQVRIVNRHFGAAGGTGAALPARNRIGQAHRGRLGIGHQENLGPIPCPGNEFQNVALL